MKFNGYRISLEKKDDVINLVDDIRNKFNDLAVIEMKRLIAEDMAFLYDTCLVNGARYNNTSIFDLAIHRVKDNIGLVYSGKVKDDKFNLFANLYLYRNPFDKKDKDFYALIVCNNAAMISYFESLKQVTKYDYDDSLSDSDFDNEIARDFWSHILKNSNYDYSNAGLAAKLVDAYSLRDYENFDIDELIKLAPSIQQRQTEFVRATLTSEHISKCIGNTPINSIDPLSLSRLFCRVADELAYVEKFQNEFIEKIENTKFLFQALDKGILTTVQCSDYQEPEYVN